MHPTLYIGISELLTNRGKVIISRVFRILVCLGIIVVLFYLYLPPHENCIDTMNKTVGYNHVDILCVGSSHMFCGLNPAQMYKDHGFAAYIIAHGSQSPWQSYYYLKEALRTQTPQLVILDVYMFQYDYEAYQDYQTVVNLLNTPLSCNKISALNASVAESKLNILLRFPYIYDEYDEWPGFTLEKYYGNEDYSLGFNYDNTTDKKEIEEYGIGEADNVTSVHKINEKNEEYLRKIVCYCKDRGIEIVLINAPWPFVGYDSQARFNYIDQIASEYDICFIDGNRKWDDIGVDWTTDSMGNGGHLNYSGVTKFTAYTDRILERNFKLPDRRGNTDYLAWEESVRWLEQEIDGESKN